MASIISKKVNGQTYYYLRQMARVNGKPKMAWERYLGKARTSRLQWQVRLRSPSGPGTSLSGTSQPPGR
jgi:hypothetical protein